MAKCSEIKVEAVVYDNDIRAFNEITPSIYLDESGSVIPSMNPYKTIDFEGYEFLYIRVLMPIKIDLDDTTVVIDVIIRIANTAQVSYLCKSTEDTVKIIKTSYDTNQHTLIFTKIFTEIFKQVTLVLSPELLDKILSFCEDLNIILHKEEITIGLMKKIDVQEYL